MKISIKTDKRGKMKYLKRFYEITFLKDDGCETRCRSFVLSEKATKKQALEQFNKLCAIEELKEYKIAKLADFYVLHEDLTSRSGWSIELAVIKR